MSPLSTPLLPYCLRVALQDTRSSHQLFLKDNVRVSRVCLPTPCWHCINGGKAFCPHNVYDTNVHPAVSPKADPPPSLGQHVPGRVDHLAFSHDSGPRVPLLCIPGPGLSLLTRGNELSAALERAACRCSPGNKVTQAISLWEDRRKMGNTTSVQWRRTCVEGRDIRVAGSPRV